MKKQMIKKSVLAAGMAVAMLGMATTASAKSSYWFCDAGGEDYSNISDRKGVVYITSVFYSSDRVYESDFLNSIHGDFLSKGVHCFSYNTKKKAKHSRNESINSAERYDQEIRYSGFDG